VDPLQPDVSLSILSALAAGGLIGLERSFHGRPAGFRTHALVSLASALLMVLSVHQLDWFTTAPVEAIRIDPSRMAQGIMTGIGFLDAGVIFKEGVNVRGLTTAASIWLTAALGVLFGAGFYAPALLGTAATLGVLAAFRWLERRMPSQFFAELVLCVARTDRPTEAELRDFLEEQSFDATTFTYRLREAGQVLEFKTVIHTLGAQRTEALV